MAWAANADFTAVSGLVLIGGWGTGLPSSIIVAFILCFLFLVLSSCLLVRLSLLLLLLLTVISMTMICLGLYMLLQDFGKREFDCRALINRNMLQWCQPCAVFFDSFAATCFIGSVFLQALYNVGGLFLNPINPIPVQRTAQARVVAVQALGWQAGSSG